MGDGGRKGRGGLSTVSRESARCDVEPMEDVAVAATCLRQGYGATPSAFRLRFTYTGHLYYQIWKQVRVVIIQLSFHL